MQTIEVIPDPVSLMESMRAVGYSLETAIADLIDNSISASAANVWVEWSGVENPYVAILDDGTGMSEDALTNAMRHGSRNPAHSERIGETDLGRFGLGLKTASLSQARQLTVISKSDDVLSIRQWDMDLVALTRKWTVSIPDLSLQNLDLAKKLAGQNSGTLVIWRKLDRLIAGASNAQIEITEKFAPLRDHLSLVFHRFTSPGSDEIINRVNIFLNDKKLVAKDPFLRRASQVQRLESQQISHDLGTIDVQPWILPPISRLTRDQIEECGGSEGLRSSQGFYIYRAKRLVIWGTWFRLAGQDEFYKLARVQVDIPNSFDSLWSLDIKKSVAVPPDVIRARLRTLVGNFTGRSRVVLTYPGRVQVKYGERPYLWQRMELPDGGARYIINPEHESLKKLSEALPPQATRQLNGILELLSYTLPTQAIYADMATRDHRSLESHQDVDTLVKIASAMTQATGLSYEEVLHIEPLASNFQMHDEILRILKRADK
jgi:hypothetical protein